MKVLLADDHALFREGVRMVLENLVAGEMEVLEVSDYHQALMVVRDDPNIAVGFLDLNMPGMDGFLGIEALRRLAPALRMVVVSASTDPSHIRRALDAGANGYIAKSSPSASMIEAMRSVLDGKTYLSPDLAEAPLDRPLEGRYAMDLRQVLTPRQRDVLAMLRHGKSNKEIAREMQLAEITVKLHVTAILKALGVENRTQAAILAAKLDA